MKELSIEEKAKAYDKALQKAKFLHEAAANGRYDIEVKTFECLFPELKESEDERIRQKFIKLIKMSSEVGGFALHKWEADEMLAWLEKQIVWKPTKEQMKLLKEAIDKYYFDLDGLCPLYVLYRELENIGIRE